MKLPLLSLLLIVTSVNLSFGQIKLPNPFKKGEKIELPKIKSAQRAADELMKTYDRKQPISTTFDDADYEVIALHDFEPNESAYMPLDIQPKDESGSYILKSGLYSMNAKSFCLRGYTHGPNRGDGHLYAPLKGKKADFVQLILERFGQKPEVRQQDVQVLIWAIIAGADMNALGEQHSNTLNQLFTMEELLTFQGKDWLNGIADEQINELRMLAMKKVSPQLQGFIEADNRIRSMVRENKSFQEIERVAIIAGVAPASDMIREVSKGRWSYHPDGFFVRFFPNGYPQTRVDVYVPLEGEIQQDASGEVTGLNKASYEIKEVVFNPSSMTAMPANRSSQRIGLSSAPVKPTPAPFEEFSNLPNCPCHYDDKADFQKENGGEWIKCGAANQQYHFGAAYEMRWRPPLGERAGQQCTYDSNKNLITGGIAAGTPDLVSPRACGKFVPESLEEAYMNVINNWNENMILNWGYVLHWYKDVRTWSEKSCTDYVKFWAPNNGNGCQKNEISNFTHMDMMDLVGDMDCEEISILLTGAINGLYADERLKRYLLNKNNSYLSKSELINLLESWRSQLNYPEHKLGKAIEKAISNLNKTNP